MMRSVSCQPDVRVSKSVSPDGTPVTGVSVARQPV